MEQEPVNLKTTASGCKLFTKGGDVKSIEDISAKYVFVYFSAHWCPPCRSFTPMLKEFYEKEKEKGNFEIIFVSSDRDQTSFDEYFKGDHGDWLALDFAEREKKAKLCEQYGVRGIPTLKLFVVETEEEVQVDGRSCVQSKDYSKFPWSKMVVL